MRKLRTMHLFAGAGGGILADLLLGHQPVCAVEINEYCQQVLSARQADGTFPWFPIFADVTKFYGRPWQGLVDVVSGGFPCQDISVAGTGKGLAGERSGLWSEMARIIGEVRPRFAFIENSPMLVSRGLDIVLADLAALGFDVAWRVLSASDVGAPHIRGRIWLVASNRNHSGQRAVCRPVREPEIRNDSGRLCFDVPDLYHRQRDKPHGKLCPRSDAFDCRCISDSLRERRREVEQSICRTTHAKRSTGDVVASNWGSWPPESGVLRVVDGMAHRVDRIKAIGNGQVPRVAAAAFVELAAEFE